jgi:hypothetical protein
MQLDIYITSPKVRKSPFSIVNEKLASATPTNTSGLAWLCSRADESNSLDLPHTINQREWAQGVNYIIPQNNDDENPMKGRFPKERDEIRSELYQIICATKSIKSMACVTCIAAAYEMSSVTCSDDLYHYTYMPPSERFQYYLQDLSKTVGRTETGIIVADHRGTKPDATFRKARERLLRSEAEFTSNYQNLVESLFFLPSDISVGIQLADMVAGAVWRKFEKNDDRCYTMLEPSIRKSPSGKIDGYGIVRFLKGKWT